MNTQGVGAPAPELKWLGDKWNHKGCYNKDTQKGYYFYQLPMPLMDYICSQLDGKNGLCIKIMIVLIGTDKGFKISEKWICDRIGIDSNDRNKTRSYRAARQRLCELGWINFNSAEHTIELDYDYLYQEAFNNDDNCGI